MKKECPFKRLFCRKKKEAPLPFDAEKAYVRRRGGVMAGGNIRYTFSREGVVKLYSKVDPAPENECGMRDKGATLYFVGLKEGEVTVTETEYYPTCPPESAEFTLSVSADLTVTLKE